MKRLSVPDNNSNKIINLADPTNAQDAATKAYVDSVAGGVAGSNTQVLFNDSGVVGADAGLTYNKTTNMLIVSNISPISTETLELLGSPTTASLLSLQNLNAAAYGTWTFTPDDAADVPLTIQMVTTQTASGLVVKNASAVTVADIKPDGTIRSLAGIHGYSAAQAVAMFGSDSYLTTAYINVTGNTYSTFPGKASAEVVIGQDTGGDGVESVFKIVSQNYLGAFTNRLRIMGSTGDVGIGNGLSPSAKLHVDGDMDKIVIIAQAHSTQTTNLVEYRNSSGTLQLAIAGNGRDFVIDTTTGSKIGTGTTQKIGFWNATPVVQSTGWSVTNEASDKSFDADSTSIDEIADVLGTLIETLKTYGILGA